MPPKGSSGKRRSTTSAKAAATKQPPPQAMTGKKPGPTLSRTFSATKQQLGASDSAKAKTRATTSVDDDAEVRELVRKCSGIIKRSKKEMGTPIHAEANLIGSIPFNIRQLTICRQGWDDLITVLRVFDANPDFGPCSHQTRLGTDPRHSRRTGP
ncbi:hypothetical protein OIV83_005878 [Microbotryomycetes sp. JL201]|nr:hypothetical protein OIV83_005878 [Microbotryomycetes sp. JL201]